MKIQNFFPRQWFSWLFFSILYFNIVIQLLLLFPFIKFYLKHAITLNLMMFDWKKCSPYGNENWGEMCLIMKIRPQTKSLTTFLNKQTTFLNKI